MMWTGSSDSEDQQTVLMYVCRILIMMWQTWDQHILLVHSSSCSSICRIIKT